MNFITYIFISPSAEFLYYIPIMVFVAIMFIAAISITLLSRNDKALRKTFKEKDGNLITLGATIIVLLGARYEAVPFISMRFLLGTVLLASIYSLVRVGMRYLKQYPEHKAQIAAYGNQPTKKKYSHSKKK